MNNGLVKVADARTRELKRWETPEKGKPMAIMENGSLVLTRVGRQLGYKVSNKELVRRG
ncbi:unnamed protein product [marine sediment metagenome]|uniref:Uncharacterized protein n=1 Tax=marine sediment metagenome TaxID=412755 RepID=X1VFB4_9ZZZZ